MPEFRRAPLRASSNSRRTLACTLWGSLLLGGATTVFAAPGVKVNHLTSFHQYSEAVSSSSSPEGWPGAQRPTSPPLYVKHPTLPRGYLYGGFAGQNSNILRGVPNLRSGAGLYWLPALPGVYERLSIGSMTHAVDNELYGRINGTPLRGSDGGLYGVMTSVHGERADNVGSDGLVTRGARYLFTATVGRGVVFRTDADGTHMTAVTRPGDLFSPNGALVVDDVGNFYGVDKGPQGLGRVFKVTVGGAGGAGTAGGTGGVVSTVHEFQRAPNGTPQVPNGLILGSDGALYGVTGFNRGVPFKAGTPSAATTPVGSLYRIDPANPGGFAVLYTFTLAEGEINIRDNVVQEHAAGSRGMSWLVEGRDGWLYGTTTPTCEGVYNANASWNKAGFVVGASPQCGTHNRARTYGDLPYPYYDGPVPHGAVYRLRKDGAGGLQVLHRFKDSDGSAPRGPLAVGVDGSIYGTTLTGGANRHWAGVTTQGNQDRPATCDDYMFVSQQTACKQIGAANDETLLNLGQAVSDGVLYRVVPANIQASGGDVQSGGFELLHSFKRNVDGLHPLGLTAAEDGRLYGAAANGGNAYKAANGTDVAQDDEGTVFQVDLLGDTPSAGITLNVASPEIKVGESAVFTWTSFQTRDCRAESSAGDWSGAVATSGSLRLTPPGGTYRYSVVCMDTVKNTEVSSGLVTLYVGAPATVEDGNTVKYGGGGGGPLAPALLLPLTLICLLRRRSCG